MRSSTAIGAGYVRGTPLLTREQRAEIEDALVEAAIEAAVQRTFGAASGIETQLARRYGISRQRINQIKRTLMWNTLFYHRQQYALIGRAINGRFFLVDLLFWQRSMQESVTVARMSHQAAAVLNLRTDVWEDCVGTSPHVRYWDEEE